MIPNNIIVKALRGHRNKQTEKASVQKFKIKLVSAGNNQVATLRLLRELTGYGMKAGKEIVDAAPSVMMQVDSQEQADRIKASFEDAGAKIELVPTS